MPECIFDQSMVDPYKYQYNKAQTIRNQYGMAIHRLQITNSGNYVL